MGLPIEMAESELLPTLEKPWVFDGYRRIYNDGIPTDIWQARAIDPSSGEKDAEGRIAVTFVSGQGRTFAEALHALMTLLTDPET